MRMEFVLKEIDVFVKVIELGSFKEAARELHLTQSALTQRLKKLEEALGVRLIDRTTRSVAPTAVGRSFLPEAKRLIAQFEKSMSNLQDLIHVRSGRVTIASLISVATYVLPQAIRRFGERYPDVGVRVFDDSEQEIAEYVRRGEAEFAIDMRTAESDPGLAITPVMEDHFVMACRADHPLAAGGPVQWEALADMPVIMLGPRSGTNRLLRSHLPEAKHNQAWRYEVQHLSTMIGFIKEGLGVGIMPYMAMRGVSGRDLIHRPLVEPDFGRTVVIVEQRGATLSPAAERLKALLLDEFQGLRQTL